MSEKTDKSKLKKLKHVKVYDQLYEQIKNGTYPPEAQLPPETTLAASMNVSRMTLRKALLLLIEDGLFPVKRCLFILCMPTVRNLWIM